MRVKASLPERVERSKGKFESNKSTTGVCAAGAAGGAGMAVTAAARACIAFVKAVACAGSMVNSVGG